MLPEFTIDDQFLKDVTTIEHRSKFEGRDDLTPEELVEVLEGRDTWTIRGSQDHPVFANLRNTLEAQGYIRTERSWCNGDRVLEPFKLNGIIFGVGDKFPSAAAMSGELKFKQKFPEY